MARGRQETSKQKGKAKAGNQSGAAKGVSAPFGAFGEHVLPPEDAGVAEEPDVAMDDVAVESAATLPASTQKEAKSPLTLGEETVPPSPPKEGTALHPCSDEEEKRRCAARDAEVSKWRAAVEHQVEAVLQIPRSALHKGMLRHVAAELADCVTRVPKDQVPDEREAILSRYITHCEEGTVLFRPSPVPEGGSSPSSALQDAGPGPLRTQRQKSVSFAQQAFVLRQKPITKPDLAGGSSRPRAKTPTPVPPKDELRNKRRELGDLRRDFAAAKSDVDIHVSKMEEIRGIPGRGYDHDLYQHHHRMWDKAARARNAFSKRIARLEASIEVLEAQQL